MARFWGYANREWWWWIMYLNLAAAKKHDPESYDMLVDLIVVVFNQEESNRPIAASMGTRW